MTGVHSASGEDWVPSFRRRTRAAEALRRGTAFLGFLRRACAAAQGRMGHVLRHAERSS